MEHRPAKAARIVSAADLLDGAGDPSRARLAKVATFDPEAAAPDNRADHLALWAEHHGRQEQALPLHRCVADVTSPELSGGRLIGVRRWPRSPASPPPPCAATSPAGRTRPAAAGERLGPIHVSKSVAADWTEDRRRSAEGVREVFAGQEDARLSPGAAAARKRYAKSFHAMLWERPDIRKRWVLRHRNEQADTGIANDLAGMPQTTWTASCRQSSSSTPSATRS
ncbi:hypothetical protein ACFYWU_37695 [Streptomyces chrestomyceticus]|uniref:hypothetical protein n=1 Tax=Streptomyces chrestomyceticus TaxID=68185 RepID=UPI003682B0E6